MSAIQQALLATAPTGGGVPRTGLVAEYLLATNSLDTSGNGYNGTDTAITYSSGCAVFNGTTSKISIGNVLDETGANPFSLSCWVKFNSFSTQQMIFGKQLNSGSFGGYMLWKQRSALSDFISFSLVSNDSTFGQINKSTTYNGITTGAWYHIVGTYDGSKTAAGTKIYINTLEGYESAQTLNTMGAKSISNTADFGIGSRNSGNLPVNGSINKVRKYNRVLNAGEIAALYAEG